jgi:hypothetical protein
VLEPSGPPRFLANPHARMPRSLTPARPRRLALPLGAPVRPSTSCTVSALACGYDFEARRAAYALPVYASQPGSPPHHATLGSGWSLPFAGRDRPAGFDRRFQFAINFPLLQASLAHARIQQDPGSSLHGLASICPGASSRLRTPAEAVGSRERRDSPSGPVDQHRNRAVGEHPLGLAPQDQADDPGSPV